MVKRVFSVVLLVTAAAALATNGCGDDTADGTPVDCTTVKKYSELSTAWSKCTSCHSTQLTDPTDRQSAPDEFNYDTYEVAKQFPAEIKEQVEDDEMPPDGSPTLTTQEKTDLLTWVECNTPN